MKTKYIYTAAFASAVRDRVNNGSYSDRYIARTDEGTLYLTDTGGAENKISIEHDDEDLISEIIDAYAPGASLEEELYHLSQLLISQGEFFHGGRPAEVAVEWLLAGYTATYARPWMAAGVWTPSVADILETGGQSASDLRKIDGDLVYAWCNGDKAVEWPKDESGDPV